MAAAKENNNAEKWTIELSLDVYKVSFSDFFEDIKY